MIVSIDKTYTTRSRIKVILYAVYPDQAVYPVHGALVYKDGEIQCQTWNLTGSYSEGSTSNSLDLVEVSPYKDWKIDDKVIVWNLEDGEVFRRYFAGISHDGHIQVFKGGVTSWSNFGKKVVNYKHGRLAPVSVYSKEEL